MGIETLIYRSTNQGEQIMDTNNIYGNVALENNVIVSGLYTDLKIIGLEGLDYMLIESKICSAEDNKDGTISVSVSDDINRYLTPSIDVVVAKSGMLAKLFRFTLKIRVQEAQDKEFSLSRAVLRTKKDVAVTLVGPIGHSYRLVTNKVGSRVLDKEFIRGDREWTAINKPINVKLIRTNGLDVANLRFEWRCNQNPNRTKILVREVGVSDKDTHYRTYTQRNTSCMLMNVGEVVIKGADPILTCNPYVAGFYASRGLFETKTVPTSDDNNVSTLRHDMGRSMAIRFTYCEASALTILENGDKVCIRRGKTIYKAGKASTGDHIPFDLEENDVVMKFDGFGRITGPVFILLRKPTEPCIWVKGKDTRVRIQDGTSLNISGGILPNSIPALYRNFLAGGVMQVDYVPETGFVQTT